MRFVKFNFLNGGVFCFCLDDVVTIESDNRNTRIVLRIGSEKTLSFDADDFCTKVFSDEHGYNEYQLIEIDESRTFDLNSMIGDIIKH